MAGAVLVPQAIVLALGAGALGGPDALRLLLQFAGRSAAVDLAICLVVISLLAAPLLGTMLLARFVRKAGPGAGAAPGTDLFAQVTATVSVGAAFLVTACLLVVPAGLGGAVRSPIDFAINNPIVVTVLAICAAFAAATGTLPCAVPLLPAQVVAPLLVQADGRGVAIVILSPVWLSPAIAYALTKLRLSTHALLSIVRTLYDIPV